MTLAMKKSFDTLFVVTGISRLTGEREAVSKPSKWPVARILCIKWMSVPARFRVFLRLKVEPYSPVINFKNKE